jgi:hypothetical protein
VTITATHDTETGTVEVQAGNRKLKLSEEDARELVARVRAALPKGKSKPAGLGGPKGQAIAKYLRRKPDAPASEVAEKCGCSPARVAEVRRALAAES